MNTTHLVKDFNIEIERIDLGWEHIKLRFDDIEIPFEASYIGSEPISTLAVSIFHLENHFYITTDNYFPSGIGMTSKVKYDSRPSAHQQLTC